MSSTSAKRRPYRALVGTALATSVGVLCLGGATDRALAIAAVGALFLAWSSAGDRPATIGRRGRVGFAAIAAMGCVAFLQLVPLPVFLLRFLSPRSAELWAQADASVGVAPHAHPLSLDPPATSFALATLAVTLAFFWSAARLTRRGEGERVIAGVAITAGVFAVVTLAHSVVHARSVFGLYVPHSALVQTLPIVTPLVNPNHAAAMAGVGLPLFVGLGLTTGASMERRILCFSFAALAVATTALTLSRSGLVVVGAEAAAMLTYGIARAFRADRGEESRERWRAIFPIAGASGIGAVGAAYVAQRAITHEWSTLDASKGRLVRDAGSAVFDFKWFGVGDGAYGAVSGSYAESLALATDPIVRRLSHVESWPVDLAVGFGVPVALAITAAFAWCAIVSARRAISKPVHFGAAVALGGLVAHDLADFSMAFVGVGGVAAVLFAALVVEPTSGRRDQDDARRPLRALTGQVALALCAIPILGLHWGHRVEDDLASIGAGYTSASDATVDGRIDAAIAAHPGESFFVLAKGVRAVNTAEGGALLARAVVLAPTRPQPHFWLARWLVRAGRRGQAWAEYREALRLAPGLIDVVFDDLARYGAPVDEMVSASKSANDLERAIPALERNGRSADTVTIDDALIDRFPPALSATARRIRRAHAAKDDVTAQRLEHELEAAHPEWAPVYLVASEIAPNDDEAEAALVRGLARVGDDPSLLEALIRRRGPRFGLAGIPDALARMRAVCEAQGCLSAYYAVQGDVELAGGHEAAALHDYQLAAEASSDGLGHLEQLATVAEQLKLWELAINSWSRLAAAHPERPEYAQRMRMDEAHVGGP